MTPESDSTHLYDYPEYYELAFSFRDIAHEVSSLEGLFDRFARIPVYRVLELACGPSPYLQEFCRRGYEYHGLDSNPKMLAAARRKVLDRTWKSGFHRSSMIDFRIETTFQFVFVPLGSLYAKNTDELMCHFLSVASALDSGGLYMLDWCVQFGQTAIFSETGQTWIMERDDLSVEVNVKLRSVDPAEQLVEEIATLAVSDHGRRLTISSTDLRRLVYPQEFLLLVDSLSEFEFVGWWNDWNVEKPMSQVTGEISRPIALLRRT